MKQHVKVFIAILCMGLGIIATTLTTTQVLAADETANSQPKKSRSGFSVQAILPEEQTDQDLGYFDLQTTPNSTHEVGVRLFGTGTESITVIVEVTNAYTANSGNIAYNKYNVQLYNHKQTAVSDMVQGKRRQIVTLAPGETKEVKYTLKLPEAAYQGLALGAITATGKISAETSGQMTVNNQIAYSLGIVLRQGDSQSVVPAFKVGRVRPKIYSTEKGVGIKIANTAAMNASKVTMHTKFYKDGKLVKTVNQSSIAMAPNSQFEHFVPIKLHAGAYKIVGQIQSSNGGQQKFTKHLTVTKKQANKKVTTIPSAETPKETHNIGWIVLFIALGIIVLAIIWIGIYYFAMAAGKQKRAAHKARQHKENRRTRSKRKP